MEATLTKQSSFLSILTWLGTVVALLAGLSMPLAHRDTEGLAIEATASAPNVTTEQAIAVAVNDLIEIEGGYQLCHPRYIAHFTSQGLHFSPRRGGPDWSWRLTYAGAEAGPLTAAVDLGAVTPVNKAPGLVAFPRGGLIEQYVLRASSIEQQFVIPGPLTSGRTDVVITGAVSSTGEFETTPQGWLWRTAEGLVSLGDVRVVDASGRELPATMTATDSETRIVVAGAALAQAAYPVTIDPEIGANDFRLSDMGLDGNTNYDARDPAVAYNTTNNEYLVVWHGDDDTALLVDGELEIFAQRVDADSGAEIGTDFRLSDMGPDGDTSYAAYNPAVAYNATNNEYLVVWYGDDDTAPLVDGELEIFGQRVSADSGAEIGVDFRLSDMGPDGDTSYAARGPAIVYNSTDNEYLVVWYGDDNTDLLVDGEWEIFGQRVDADSGAEIGTDFRLSDMGPDGDTSYAAYNSAVAYNSEDNEYLVVWQGLVDGELEIFGQRVDATSGDEVGSNDFRLSDMGPDWSTSYAARGPAIAYNSMDNEYLVVWYGDDNTGPLVNGELEIFGQRVDADSGDEVGSNDFRLSDMGPDEDVNYTAYNPAVAYSAIDNEYLVVWHGDDDTALLVDGELEIFGQRVDADSGDEIGTDFRLSDMGPDGDTSYAARGPAIAYSSMYKEYLVVWQGDDDTGLLVDNESEIFGQRYQPSDPAPILTLTKTVDDETPDLGQLITCTITINNSGLISATNGLVSDTLPGGLNFVGPATLDPPQEGVTLAQDSSDLPTLVSGLTITNSTSVSVIFSVTVDTGLTGGTVITNTAGVTSTEVTTPVTGIAVITTVSNPALSVTKTANVSTANVGQTITYTYRVTNTGNVNLTGVSASDDKLGAITLDSTSLAPDAGTSGTLTYTVVVGDLPGPLANTVAVTSNEVTTPVMDTAAVTIASNLALTVTKTANVSTASVGQTITYTYRVTNTGDVNLTGVSASDDKLGAITLDSTSLAPDAGTSGTLTYEVVAGDLPGPLANTVTVTSTPPTGPAVIATADESVALTLASVTPKEVYLPLIWKGFVSTPDLVVDSLVATSDAVTVTIRNQSNAPVRDAFWVDVYFNPSVTPGLNQPWDTIASHGVVWGITTTIPASGSLILTIGGDYYFPEYSSPAPLPVGANVYALVDSINYDTTYGAVLESDEGNNLFGPVTSTAGVASQTASAGDQGKPTSKEGLPPRQ